MLLLLAALALLCVTLLAPRAKVGWLLPLLPAGGCDVNDGVRRLLPKPDEAACSCVPAGAPAAATLSVPGSCEGVGSEPVAKAE
ncbi:hypothetical protein STCU_12297 [Strigomonas culicis]|uniref:Secreted protein n=1 Tax=Strigomonas culicis TaxID=28005 RepID=S9TFR5_9TRYP|nr:hypothetical protein STCU_12297 [Strigomonas culicis]|eukprot:EPY15163.1 hypothetical protein STCU_12297 [Strigomonas culicis]